MDSAGFDAIDLAIEHEGDSGERMPESCVTVSERPKNPVETQAAADVWILIDV